MSLSIVVVAGAQFILFFILFYAFVPFLCFFLTHPDALSVEEDVFPLVVLLFWGFLLFA